MVSFKSTINFYEKEKKGIKNKYRAVAMTENKV